MNILEVKDLCKTYIVNKRQNNVLKNVSFTVSEGEMAAFRLGEIHAFVCRFGYGLHYSGRSKILRKEHCKNGGKGTCGFASA